MAIPDLSDMPFDDLVDLYFAVKKQFEARREEERRKFLTENSAVLEVLDLSISAQTSDSKRPTDIVQPDLELARQQHRDDPHRFRGTSGPEPIRFKGPQGEVWTGRGPKAPQWILDYEAQGRDREEFRIAGRPRGPKRPHAESDT